MPLRGRTSHFSPPGRVPDPALAEARAQLALEAAQVGTWDWDLAHDELTWDARCRALFGVGPAEAVSYARLLELIDPDDRGRVDAAVRASLDPSLALAHDVEFRVLHDGAGERWLHATGRAVWVDDVEARAPRRFIGTVRDVTERHEAERLHAERDERLRAALYASRTGTFRWDIRSNALDWDENLDRLFGLAPGLTVRSLDGFLATLHPDDRARVIAACERCATSGADFDEEFRVVWPDGTVHWLDDKGKTYRGDDGRPSYMTGACVEITDRKAAEHERERLLEALKESEARLRRILESGIVGSFFWSIDGRVTEANDYFLNLLGFTRDDLAAGAIDWRVMTPPAWEEQDRVKVAELLATGRHGAYRKEYLSKRGETVPVLIVSAFFENSREHGVALCLDLSARRAAEEALARREAQLHDALAAAQAARGEAEQANRAKSEFLANMSHELRTPLNAIGGYAELIDLGIRGPVTAEQRDDLARIRRSQQHLLGLINDVLNFAKLDAGAVRFNVVDVPVADALVATEAMVAPQMAAKGLRFSLPPAAAGAGLPVVRADAEKLRQVLLNLLGNAIKFTDRDGAIAVTCETADDGRTVRLTVRDTGIGIPAAKLEAIFEPFVQVDRHLARPNEGVGLGLAISRELARGMGGDLTASSVEGQGSTFVLTLPRAAVAAATTDSP